ncbi:IMPACT family protein [Mucilaginibacter aquatilis]|uniref:YigZ family protein n=1 Tax=Mucilaginibacter aquatilis TaxID=1517760 RepID=A0A6I4ICY8_9SPHI|nr:YigZ family protein [Mucilaginibacter aquatilis]MVN91309.1 YigZ family protein [Mucilaginibacter aquatilis]
MLFNDTYLTVKQPAEAIFADRGSKFIAFVYPIKSEADVKPLVSALKAVHTKANHHCWAMRLSPDRSVFKVNDDGEPSGTAGRPILNVLLSKDVTNVLVVVVRYFGGKLLGVPGLINAYKTAAEMGLSAAGIVENVINDVYQIEFDYLQMNDIMKIIKEEGTTIIEQESDNRCIYKIAVRKMKVNQTIARFNSINKVKVDYLHSN